MKTTIKLARKSNGRHFVECGAKHWELFMELWMLDNTHPEPLPVGHNIFKHPKSYNATVTKIDANLILESARQALAREKQTH